MVTRAREQRAFGLVELLIAMTILNIGILAVVAALNSGAVALRRAGALATAATLADAQMERYRGLTYAAIILDKCSEQAGDSRYAGDTALAGSPTKVVTAACTTPPPAEQMASRAAVGADGKNYRVDTYIVYDTPPGGRQLKKVTIVIRDGNYPSRVLAREASTFDESTGL